MSGARALSVVAAQAGHGGTGHGQSAPSSAETRTTAARAPRMLTVRAVFVLFCLQAADFSDPPCIIELECAECVPDNMPIVRSHRAADGAVRVEAGGELTLACAPGKFLLYPLAGTLAAVCEAGRYRVRQDLALRHILDLGCQENVFEDVLHQVEQCGPPLQGRAYLVQEAGGRARHLSAACYSADRALALRLQASNAPDGRLALPPHSDQGAPLSILGNFNHMFDANTRHDAERLYSDDVRLNRRLHQLFEHDGYSFAAQTLTAAKLLSARYFEDQNARVTDFVSNRVASWKSVVEGNLHHLHRDVAKFMNRNRGVMHLDVYAGTHGVLSLNTGDRRTEVYLKAGNRFPVPKYIWTVLHAKNENRGLAVILLNDPYVIVSEIREAVFCESTCGSVSWLIHLKRNRNYERPVSGLVFCCSLPDFAERVPEMPNIFNGTVRNLL